MRNHRCISTNRATETSATDAMTDGTKIADFQENFFPDDFFRETEHAIMNRNNAGTENARLVIRSDGIYVYGVNGKTHYELKGSLHYIAK